MEKTVHLSRTLGAFEVFTITAGTMIGAGIFVLPGILYARVGASSVLCFLLVGVLSMCTALSTCELATAMPKSGGGYFFISRSMGSMVGSIVGWGSILALIFKGAFAFVGAGDYLQALVPAAPLATALALCVLLITLNTAGAGATGHMQNMIVTVMVAIMLAFVVQGLFSFDARNLEPFFRGSPSSFMEATGMVFMAYLGLMHATSVAEEVKDPGRNIPLGVLTAVGFVTMLYTLIMLVTQGVLRPWALAETTTPIADAAEKLAGTGGLVIMVLCGLMATVSTANSALLSSSRYPFAMARDGQMPSFLAKVDEHLKTPVRSVVFVGGIALVLITFLNLEAIVKYGSAFNIILFGLMNASVVMLRRAKPSWFNPSFRSPGYPWVQIAGTLGSLAFVPFLGLGPSAAALGLVGAGAAWHFIYSRGRSRIGYGFRDSVRTAQEKTETIAAADFYGASVKSTGERDSLNILVLLWSSRVPPELMSISEHMSQYFGEPLQLAYWDSMTEITLLSPYEDACAFTVDGVVKSREGGPGCSLVRILAPSRPRGFVDIARESGADFVLMELPKHFSRLRWELRRIAEDMPCDMAFLAGRETKSIDSVLVANANPNDDLKLRLAGAVAARTGAMLNVLRVYPEGAREMARGDFEMQVREAGAMHGVPLIPRVVLSDDIPGTIIEESHGSDLLVLGGVSYAEKTGALLGSTVEKIVGEAECSVLVVKARSPFKTPLARRVLKRLISP